MILQCVYVLEGSNKFPIQLKDLFVSVIVLLCKTVYSYDVAKLGELLSTCFCIDCRFLSILGDTLKPVLPKVFDLNNFLKKKIP